MNTISEIAADVVDAAGAAGGVEEVRRIAERGWDEVVHVCELDAVDYEGEDALAAAIKDTADALDIEPGELSARYQNNWEEIIVETISPASVGNPGGIAPQTAIHRAIRARAAEVLA